MKFLRDEKALKSVNEEKNSLYLENHEHLVTTHCVITTNKDSKYCNVFWKYKANEIKVRNFCIYFC